MRKYPYTYDVLYSSGRTEAIVIRTSDQEARVKTQLEHMRINGLVTEYKRRSSK